MADFDRTQGQGVPNDMVTKYRDMGDGTHAEVVAVGSSGAPAVISESWRVTHTQNRILNDSDKTFTVPASTEWQVLWVWVQYTSTAAAGNRQLVVEVRNAANNVIGQFRAGAVQAASLTRYYQFGASMADLQAFRDTDWLMTPLHPGLLLQAGDQVRVYDNNAVAAAADDMLVAVQLATRSV